MVTPKLGLPDYRSAQVTLSSEAYGYMLEGDMKFVTEGGIERHVFIIPSTKIVKEAETMEDPPAFIAEKQKQFSKVFKNGLGNHPVLQEGFDAIMDMLDSCYLLFELDEPEAEIKYQCTCRDFWHMYKCRHSLALSIDNMGVKIPPMYNIRHIGTKRRRGRPALAKGGEALALPPHANALPMPMPNPKRAK